MTKGLKNRWLIALSGLGIHACIGSVYAWSVFSKPLQGVFGCTFKEVQYTFGMAIFCLGISAAFMGHVVERRGPKVGGILSAFFWCLGLVGSGIATSDWVDDPTLKLWGLHLSYGVIGGIGLGTGYVTPVSTLIKWFPDRRGLATGLAIMGFGFASFLGAPVISELIERWGVSNTFFALAAVYWVVMVASSLYLSPPPQGWSPVARNQTKLKSHRKTFDLMPMNASEAVRTWPFYGLWTMMFINISCGIALISVASPLIQEMTGVSALAAAAVVGMNGLFNGGGRIIWASVSDWLGRPATFICFFLIQIFLFAVLPELHEMLFLQVALYLIMTCYGGGFATLPAYIGDIFGTRQVSAIHGYVLTAWALAGVTGSTFAAYIREATGSYAKMLWVFSGIFVIALCVSLLLFTFVRRRQRLQVGCP